MNIQRFDGEGMTEFTIRRIRAEIIQECANVVGNMRQSEAGIFDPKHSGQRGEDRSNALYDAYQAIIALAVSRPHCGGTAK